MVQRKKNSGALYIIYYSRAKVTTELNKIT